MHKLIATTMAAAALFAADSMITRSNAAPVGSPMGIRIGADELNVLDKVQYFWGGRRYCWYNDAWRGPGWYWCGYAWRRGFGWGGPVGWRGWGRPGRYGGRYGRVGGRYGRVGGRYGRVGGRYGRVGGRYGGRYGGRVGRGGGRVGRVGSGRVGGGRVGGGRMGGRGGGRGGGRRSDIQLKHDIKLLGYLDNGLGFYRFSYNGSDKAYVGVMAQEVQTIAPEAVFRGHDGYLRVYYDRLDLTFQTYKQWRASGAQIPAGAPVRQ